MTREYPEQTSKLPGDDSASTAPYKCWFEYLQEIDRSEWAEDVAINFGEIKNTTFAQWWPDHKHLFTKVVPVVIEEIVTRQDLHNCEENGWVDDPDMAILIVHTYLPQKDIRAALKEWLEKKNLNKRGTPKFNDEFAFHYEIVRHADTYMLENALKVYKAIRIEQQKPKNMRRCYYEIEDDLKLINKKKWGAKRTPRDRDTQAQTISRYYRIAKQVIEGVKYGEFPVYDEDPPQD